MSDHNNLPQQRHDLLDLIFERAGRDLAFRSQLISNPREALAQAGYAGEFQRLGGVETSSQANREGAGPSDDLLLSGADSLFTYFANLLSDYPPSIYKGVMDYTPTRELA